MSLSVTDCGIDLTAEVYQIYLTSISGAPDYNCTTHSCAEYLNQVPEPPRHESRNRRYPRLVNDGADHDAERRRIRENATENGEKDMNDYQILARAELEAWARHHLLKEVLALEPTVQQIRIHIARADTRYSACIYLDDNSSVFAQADGSNHFRAIEMLGIDLRYLQNRREMVAHNRAQEEGEQLPRYDGLQLPQYEE